MKRNKQKTERLSALQSCQFLCKSMICIIFNFYSFVCSVEKRVTAKLRTSPKDGFLETYFRNSREQIGKESIILCQELKNEANVKKNKGKQNFLLPINWINYLCSYGKFSNSSQFCYWDYWNICNFWITLIFYLFLWELHRDVVFLLTWRTKESTDHHTENTQTMHNFSILLNSWKWWQTDTIGK